MDPFTAALISKGLEFGFQLILEFASKNNVDPSTIESHYQTALAKFKADDPNSLPTA